MTTLGSYYGASGQNGASGDNSSFAHYDGYAGSAGGNGVYVLNIGGAPYLPPGTYSSNGNIQGSAGGSAGDGVQGVE